MILDDNMKKLYYVTPFIEVVNVIQPLNLLVSMSGSAGLGDWEDEGEEL